MIKSFSQEKNCNLSYRFRSESRFVMHDSKLSCEYDTFAEDRFGSRTKQWRWGCCYPRKKDCSCKRSWRISMTNISRMRAKTCHAQIERENALGWTLQCRHSMTGAINFHVAHHKFTLHIVFFPDSCARPCLDPYLWRSQKLHSQLLHLNLLCKTTLSRLMIKRLRMTNFRRAKQHSNLCQICDANAASLPL